MSIVEAFWPVLGIVFLALLALYIALWLISIVIDDGSIIDMVWAPQLMLVAGVGYVFGDGAPDRKLLVLILTLVWGIRLGTHLIVRNIGREDARYTDLRRLAKGNFHLFSLHRIFGRECARACLVSLTVISGMVFPEPSSLGLMAYVGVLIWSIGFYFEAVADWQLTRFRADPANENRVLETGLWRYSRHPNYFGNLCVMWGIFLVACDTPLALVGLIGPVAMTYFMFRDTGVVVMERWMRRRRASYDYDAYAERTSLFFPMPPKRK